MTLGSILVTFEVPGLRFGGPGVPRGDFGAQGRPRDEKYSKSDLADPPPGPSWSPKFILFSYFWCFFPLLFGALKNDVKEQKIVSRSSKIPPKTAQNRDVLEILGFHENSCPSQAESWFLRSERVPFRCIFGVNSGAVSECISATI